MSFDFSLYLESICCRYARRQVYTLTDVVGQTAQREATFPLLGLMVQTVAIDKDPKHNESKVERFTVLEGARKYAAEHVLLVGRPGSGKSTALARLLLEEAQKAQQDSSTLIPVLVELRYYKTSVLELMRSFLQSHDLRLDCSDIETLLFQRRFLLLMDGLNELPSDEARREVKAFRQTYRKTSMIFTTRDLGIGGDLNLTHKLEMQALTEKQMQQFVRSYLPTQGDALLRQLGERLREFGQTPLLLWMLCSVFENNQNRMPSNLGSVFRRFTRIYDRKLKDDVPTSEESRRWWDGMLRSLAWGMTQGKSLTELQVAVDRDKAEQWLTAFLNEKLPYPESCANQWLDDLLKHHLIQLGTGTQIEFRHQLIQEYYAAEQLLKQLSQLNDDCLKWDYLNYLKWTEPIALMLELVEDEPEALRVVRLALEVDLMLGAKLAGKVKVEWQGRAITLVQALDLPQIFKIHLLGVGRSEAAIPALIELLKDTNTDICKNAIDALSRIGSEATIPTLIELLKDKNYSMRRSAENALSKIGSEATIPTLIELFKSTDTSVRRSAANALSKIGSEAAIPTLIELLKDKDTSVRRSAANALSKIGSEAAIPVLIELLKDKDSAARWIAASALGKIGSEIAIPALIELLKDKNHHVLENVVGALSKIGSEAAISVLSELLKDKNSFVRERAASSLSDIIPEAAVPVLIELLKDKDSDVRMNAAETLGWISSEAAVPVLIELLKDKDSDVRMNAIYALSKIGSEVAISVLIELLKDRDFYVRSIAVSALGEIASEAVVLALTELFKDKNHHVRASVASALGKTASEAAIPVLLKLLKDKDSDVREQAVSALGKIGSEGTMSQLKQCLHDESSDAARTIAALTAIQNRCKRYNAEPSREKAIAAEARTSDLVSQQQPQIIVQGDYIAGDKMAGDKVAGHKIITEVAQIVEKNDGEVIAKQSE